MAIIGRDYPYFRYPFSQSRFLWESIPPIPDFLGQVPFLKEKKLREKFRIPFLHQKEKYTYQISYVCLVGEECRKAPKFFRGGGYPEEPWGCLLVYFSSSPEAENLAFYRIGQSE